MMKRLAVMLAMVGALALVGPASAKTVSWTGVSGVTTNAIGATAEFSIVGNELTIILRNTSPVDTSNNADALTAMLFTITGNETLTVISGMGNVVNYADQNPGTGLTANGYQNILSSAYTGGHFGGWGLADFEGDAFQGINYDWNLAGAGLGLPHAPASVDGGDFHLLTNAGTWVDNTVGVRSSATSGGTDPSAIFKFNITVPTGAPAITEADIVDSQIAFLFGTASDGNTVGIVPEPGLTVLALGAVVAGVVARRRRKKDAEQIV